MAVPDYVSRDRVAVLRGEPGFDLAIDGLWVQGCLEGLGLPCVAIVGTRAATAYGRRLAGQFAGELGQAGCCIISGLALGIDAAAHAGAIDAGALTIGVLGGGHERFFPRRNAGLAERIIACGGAVLSPFPPECDPRPGQFLARNGVVAALADALVVIEAPARSGALNTAQWAAGRIPVLAVPGDVDRAHVAGCHALIRDGATLARGAHDVLETLGLQGRLRPSAPPPLPDGIAGSVYAALGEASDLDTLARQTHASVPSVLAAIAQLELAGIVESCGSGRYARVR